MTAPYGEEKALLWMPGCNRRRYLPAGYYRGSQTKVPKYCVCSGNDGTPPPTPEWSGGPAKDATWPRLIQRVVTMSPQVVRLLSVVVALLPITGNKVRSTGNSSAPGKID